MPQGQPQKAAPGARKAQTGRAAWEQLVTELTPFHTPQGEAYVILPRNGHRETWPVKSTAVRDWLRMNLGLPACARPRPPHPRRVRN